MFFNSLGPGDAIWQQRSGSPLAQIMACCLMAPSHYLNQCWLIINEVLWHSLEDRFAGNAQDSYPWYEFDYYWTKITAAFSMGEWVKKAWCQICHHSPLLCEIIDPGLVILLSHRHRDKSLEHAHILRCKRDGDVDGRLWSQPHTLVMAQQEAEWGRLVDYNFRLLTHGRVKLLVWFCSEKYEDIALVYKPWIKLLFWIEHVTLAAIAGAFTLVSLACSQASETHLKIGHPSISSTSAQSSYELQWLNLQIGIPILGHQGSHLNIKTVFPGMGIPMLKIRRSCDRLIFNMGIPILVRHLYIETIPWLTCPIKWSFLSPCEW